MKTFPKRDREKAAIRDVSVKSSPGVGSSFKVKF